VGIPIGECKPSVAGTFVTWRDWPVIRWRVDELTDLEAGRALGHYETLTLDYHSPGPSDRHLKAALADFDPHARYMFTSLLPQQEATRYERLARGRQPEAGS